MDDATAHRPHWPTYLVLIVTIVAAAAWRFQGTNHSLWFDEQASAYFAHQPWSLLWSDWMVRETNPPLFYSLLKLWTVLFGESDQAIRALSVTGSLVALLLVFLVGWRCYDRSTGLIAALLCAFSYQHLYYAQQARGYIFGFSAALTALWGMALHVDALARAERSLRGLGRYVIGAVVAIYLHTTFFILPLAATAAAVLASWPRLRRHPLLVARLIGPNLLVLIAAGWWLRITMLQMGSHLDNIAAIGLSGARASLQQSFDTLFLLGDVDLGSKVAAALIATLAAGFVWLDRARVITRFLAMTAVLALGAMIVGGRLVPIFVPRTIFWISAVPLLFASGMIARIKPGRWRLAALSFVTLIVLDNAAAAYPVFLRPDDWNTAVQQVSRDDAGRIVVESEANALLIEDACRRLVATARCRSLAVAVIDPNDHTNSWAHGLFHGQKLAPRDVPGLPANLRLYLFRNRALMGPLIALHDAGMARQVIDHDEYLIGPLSPIQLR